MSIDSVTSVAMTTVTYQNGRKFTFNPISQTNSVTPCAFPPTFQETVGSHLKTEIQQ